MPAAAKLAETPLSPERERLADAITRHREAQAALARARKAAELSLEARYAISHEIDAAEQALRQAAANAPRLRLARVLGEPVAEPTPEEIQLGLADAQHRHDEAVADSAAIDQELARLGHRVEMAAIARDDAIAAVLRPAGEALLAELHEAHRRVVTLEATLSVLGSKHGALPHGWNNLRQYEPAAAPAAAARAWIAALESSADAALDGDNLPPLQAA